MLWLIISEYYCPTTLLPLAHTPPARSCHICLCREGWLKMHEAVPVHICSSLNNQRFFFCSSWNLSNLLPTHTPAICSGLFGAVAVPVSEQLHTALPQKLVKCCFLCSLEGEIVGKVWSSPHFCSLRVSKNTSSVMIHRNHLAYKMFFLPTHTPLSLTYLENTAYC